MSTSTRSCGPLKKISSWVRPGVRDVRASALRPVSALIRLDLPTLERPAKAISVPRMGGRDSNELAAQMNCQSPANNLRPVSISDLLNSDAMKLGSAPHKIGVVPHFPFLSSLSSSFFFFLNTPMILSQSSIL